MAATALNVKEFEKIKVDELVVLKTLITKLGSDVASANNMTLGDGNLFDITGTTTINTIATKGVGTIVTLQFDGILQLTHSNDLFLPTAANITTAAGDIATLYEYAAGDWRCLSYTRADGTALVDAGGVATDTIWDAAGDLVYGTGADTAARLAAGDTTEILVGGGAAAPVWTTATGTGAPVRAGDPAFTGFPTTPVAAPDADYEVANKKYVDDNAGGDVATDEIWDAAGDLIQGTGADTAAKLSKGSALALLKMNAGGTAVEWGTAGQIAFPATAVPSADPNTLDDYEEGTYTVALTCATSGTITINTAYDTAQYVKIGKQVTVTAYVSVTSVSSPLGNLQINLPFAVGASAEGSDRVAGAVITQGIDLDNTAIQLNPFSYGGLNYVTIAQTVDDGDIVYLNSSGVSTDDYIIFTLTYFM